MSRKTLVLGCGVSGLTTAIRLLEAGHRVRILTRELPISSVSGVAPAIWHPSVAYVIPRDRDVILGGTAERGEWDLTPDPETTEEIRRKAERLDPRVSGARVLEVKVGLRPGRTEVRVGREELPAADGRPVGTVIHNYGHGGAGYTLSWGCAEDVVALTGDAT